MSRSTDRQNSSVDFVYNQFSGNAADTPPVTISHPLPAVKRSSCFDWCGTILSFTKCYLHTLTTRAKKREKNAALRKNEDEWRYGVTSSKYYYIINTVNYSETQSCRFSKSRLHSAEFLCKLKWFVSIKYAKCFWTCLTLLSALHSLRSLLCCGLFTFSNRHLFSTCLMLLRVSLKLLRDKLW